MKKKLPLLLFIAASLALCLIPSVGMIFNPTTETVGNEFETALPSLKNEDGSINFKYLSQLGDWFGKHFAFRPQAITADARIQSDVFKTSNIDTVVTGADGWLYYSSSMDDCLGRNTMTDWEAEGVVNNLRIIQDFSGANGVDFLFTIAPNTGTLYPEHLPYYCKKVSDVHNRDLVRDALSGSEVNYCDLFGLFESQDETLYFARDSHWNNKGALLAYNALTDKLGKAHEDFSGASVSRKKDFVGDLSKMLYPAGGEPEYNYYYGAEELYSYVTDTKSVEEGFIQTSGKDAGGALYMYRDSFGNALLPFFAGAYSSATFTKGFPMDLRSDFEGAKPDTFVLEIAERNLDWFLERPPLLLSPEISIFSLGDSRGEELDVLLKPSEYAPAYLSVSGSLSSEYNGAQSVFVSVKDKSGKTQTRECYTTSADGKRGYLAYFNADDFDASAKTEVSVIIKDDSGFVLLGESETVVMEE